jgi:xylulokinase
MVPRWAPGARGAFYGLTPAHGRAEMARALLEGCAFAMVDVLERLQALGLSIDRIRLCGGGARSRVWARIRADAAQRPVEPVTRADCSALGAAAIAAVAAGGFPDLAAAARQFAAPEETIAPDPAAAPAYAEARAASRRLFDTLEPIFVAPREI